MCAAPYAAARCPGLVNDNVRIGAVVCVAPVPAAIIGRLRHGTGRPCLQERCDGRHADRRHPESEKPSPVQCAAPSNVEAASLGSIAQSILPGGRRWPEARARNEKPLDFEGPHACLLSVSPIVPVSGLALAPCCVRRLPGGQRARTLAPLLIGLSLAGCGRSGRQPP